jgi:hypothetical protein
MKKILLVVFCIFLTFNIFGQISEELNSITIKNGTDYEFYYIFFSPGDTDYWGPDILGSSRTVSPGEEVEFFVHYPNEENEFDILVVDEDGDSYSFYGYSVSDGESVYLEVTMADYDEESVEMDFVTAEFVNELDYDIWYFFFSPADSEYFGVDLLDSTTVLEAGDSFEFLIPANSEAVTFDFYGFDEDEDQYSFQIDVEDSDFSVAIEPGDMDL